MHEFWYEVTPEDPIWNWHIEYICNELQKIAVRVSMGIQHTQDTIINVPPGSTKSTLCTIMFPAWCWTRWPWMRFIATSYSASLALDHAELSRDLIRSEKFQEVFSYLEIKRDRDMKSNFKVVYWEKDSKTGDLVLRNGGNRFSTSVGAACTGHHAHIILVDDPLNPEESVSKLKLIRANRFMDQTLSTRKVDKNVTATILIMQRLAEDDPAGHKIAKSNGNIKHICIPGDSISYKKYINPPELIKYYKNGLMDPVRMPLETLKKLEEDLGQYGYAGQIGQNPTPPEGGMFKPDMMSIIDVMPEPTRIVRGVRYWDKGGTEGAGAFTCGTKMYLLTNGKFLITDVKHGQWSTDQRESIIKATTEADGRHIIVWVEQEPGSGGKESAEGTIKRLAGYSARADRPKGDKTFRADPFSVQVNYGNVIMLRGDWNKKFKEELRHFPFGKYKDQVDSASGAFSKLTTRRIARVGGRKTDSRKVPHA